MKLSALFARYLYQHKRLNLPGIGVFSIDPAVAIPDTPDKNNLDFLQQIKYEQKPVVSADEELINFIRAETGKIKPLAESDLESFLSDGKILLNIGKPFQFEGIGSLMKTKAGDFEFTPGEAALPRMEGFFHESVQNEGSKRRSAFINDTQGGGNRKLLLAAALMAGLILIIWGGYALYSYNTGSKAGAVSEPVSMTQSDTSKANIILDSVQQIIDSTRAQLKNTMTATPAVYKFIIERTASKERAMKRFQQLNDSRSGVKLQTHDSTLFNIYFSIPAKASDTARIRDSLKNWYGRKQVFIEQ